MKQPFSFDQIFSLNFILIAAVKRQRVDEIFSWFGFFPLVFLDR